MRLLLCLLLVVLAGCSKPIDSLRGLNEVAVVSISYDPTIYYFHPNDGLDKDRVYAPFSWDAGQLNMHEHMLNEFLMDVMSDAAEMSSISIVRPLKLLNTSMMQSPKTHLRYEYLLAPYDPIDISDRPFMAGLAKQLNVGAVAHVSITFAVHLDEKMLWEEYNDPYAKTLSSFRMQVKHGHETSQLRTIVTIIAVNQTGDRIYNETRHVDTDSDQVHVSDHDLSFDGGVSPKLLRRGLNDWRNDWRQYL